MVIVNRMFYLFGGYQCIIRGAANKGGAACYKNDLWLADVTAPVIDNNQSVSFRLLVPQDDAKYQPSPRAYSLVVRWDRQIIVFAGAYKSDDKTWSYYNDMYAFDVDSARWVPVSQKGRIPDRRWSTSGGVFTGGILMFAGNQGDLNFNDVSIFSVGLQVTADNVTIGGLTPLKAAERGSFFIEARESYTVLRSDTPPNSTCVKKGKQCVYFGRPLTWGTGLSFDVSAVGKLPDGSASLYKGAFSEIGDGVYNASFTAFSGSVVDVYVLLDGVNIPGSPLSVSLRPLAVGSAFFSRVDVDQEGLLRAVKGERARLLLRVRDEYGNIMVSGGQVSELSLYTFASVPLVDESTTVDDLLSAGGRMALDEVVDNGDGTYTMTYWARSSAEFYVVVTLAGVLVPSRYDSGSAIYHCRVSAFNSIEVTAATKASLLVLAGIVYVFVMMMLALLLYFRSHAVFRAASPTFLTVMCLGCALMNSSILASLSVTDTSCMLYPLLLSLGLVATLGSIFVKTWRIYKIFKASSLKVTVVSDWRLLLVLLVAMVMEGFFNAMWWTFNPMVAVRRVSTSNPVLSYMHCLVPSQASKAWATATLVLKGTVSLYGLYLAAVCRDIKNTHFNETRHIALVLWQFAFCALLAVLLVLFLSESPTPMLVLKAVLVAFLSIVTPALMVGSKLYMLLTGGHRANADNNRVTGVSGVLPNPSLDTFKRPRGDVSRPPSVNTPVPASPRPRATSAAAPSQLSVQTSAPTRPIVSLRSPSRIPPLIGPTIPGACPTPEIKRTPEYLHRRLSHENRKH